MHIVCERKKQELFLLLTFNDVDESSEVWVSYPCWRVFVSYSACSKVVAIIIKKKKEEEEEEV